MIIICYNSDTKKVEKIIRGNNPITPYEYSKNHFICNSNNAIIKRGDTVEKTKNKIKIGINVFYLNEEKYTIIDEENCDSPILLEKL